MAHSRTHTYERGNAVTLTLLGLAVAILAGVVVLYFIGKRTPEPIAPINPPAATSTDTTASDPRAGWSTYEDASYGFSIQYPPGWIVATGTMMGSPVITLYDAAQALATTTDAVHMAETRVSIYPNGIAAEGLWDTEEASEVVIAIPGASTKDSLLSSGRPWSTTIRFDAVPDTWLRDGFVYARARIEEEQITHMRGETEISADEYDPYAGDHTIRHGFVNPATRTLEENILRSFAFPTNDNVVDENPTADLIRVETPQAGAVVESPFTVKGEARGTWYFEASFPVRLVTDAGEVLAEVPARALGDWMTEEFVPFEVSLTFSATTATSGSLILSKDNPSGLAELDRSVSVPVVFGSNTQSVE